MNTSKPQLVTRHGGFTLVEMLIVIVIIGILAAALIPRLTGIQSRTRDTARTAHIRDIAQAVELYSVDHSGYPRAFNDQTAIAPAYRLSASTIPTPYRLLAQSGTPTEGTVEMLGDIRGAYISLLPGDPSSKGIATANTTEDASGEITGGGNCTDTGATYAYYRDDANTMYAITMVSEASKGNTTNCAGRVDTRDGGYKTVGQGLVYEAGYSANAGDGGGSSYPDQSQWTDVDCFDFSNGVITNYGNGELRNMEYGLTYIGTCPTNVVIPETINGESVVGIGVQSFYGMNIISVTIPSSITSMGTNAFNDNGRNPEPAIPFVADGTTQVRIFDGINYIRQ